MAATASSPAQVQPEQSSTPKSRLFARSNKRKSSKKSKQAAPDPAPSPAAAPAAAIPNGKSAGEPASTSSTSAVASDAPPAAVPATTTDSPAGTVAQAQSQPSASGPGASGEPGLDPVFSPSSPPPAPISTTSAVAGAPSSSAALAPPAPAEHTPTSAESHAHTGTTTTIRAPSQAEDKDKDNRSLSTTLTGTQHTRTGRKGAQASEGAHSTASTSAPAPSPRSVGKQRVASKQRPSFLVRLVHVLVPCVGPSSQRVNTVPEEGAAVPEKVPPAAGQDAEKAVQVSLPGASVAEHPTHPPSGAPEAPTAPLEVAVPSAPTAPAAGDDRDVVVPPTPTKSIPVEETQNVTSAAVVPPGSTAEDIVQLRHSHHTHAPHESSGEESDGTSFTEEEQEEEAMAEEVEDDEDRLIMNGGAGIPIGPDGMPRPLLPPLSPQHAGRKCLVLDLDETLVHSSFKSIQQADYVVPVEIEYHWHNVYVIKRPGVDNFLKKMGEIYEIVVFTASLSKYADPVLDKLDIHRVVSHRLFRESCYNHRGNYVKDLSQLGRPTGDTIILDNSPASYIFHPNNAVPVSSWFNDPHDTELTDLCPFLADLGTVDDVRGVLDGGL